MRGEAAAPALADARDTKGVSRGNSRAGTATSEWGAYWLIPSMKVAMSQDLMSISQCVEHPAFLFVGGLKWEAKIRR